MNYLSCCLPCLKIQEAKSKLDEELNKIMPDLEGDFNQKELEQFTKVKGGELVKGNMVDALWSKGSNEWHPATIMEVKSDGTYTITWRDGMSTDTTKTVEQVRPLYKLGTFKELWVHLDENHDGKVKKSKFMRLAPRALSDAFKITEALDPTGGSLPAMKKM
jgi:hypothetical protein